MRVARRARGAVAVLAAVAVGGIADGPSAHASDGEWGLNGTYTATSNGEWARTNDVFRDEASLRGIWTISTTCSYPTNWEPCPDGTASPGFQVYRFVPVVEDGSQVDPTSTTLAGEDQTTGTPGACGISKPLFINMPFKLVKVGA
jgi:hypothetical protein